jgi:toxin ParE1/3/4
VILPLTISDEAQDDIAYNAEYLRARSETGSANFLEQVRRTFDGIQRLPRMGRVYPIRYRRLRLRAVPVLRMRSFVVFYRIERRAIHIVRVLHSARDLESLIRRG